VAYGLGRVEDARRHARDAMAVFEAVDDRFMLGWSSYTLALAELSDFYAGGDRTTLPEARRWLNQALDIFTDAQDISGYTLVLDALALAAYYEGDLSRAARLSGAVATLERTSGTGLNLFNREVLGFDPQDLRADTSLAGDWAAGEAMTTDEAVAYALDR
jgi:hypothetical protein